MNNINKSTKEKFKRAHFHAALVKNRVRRLIPLPADPRLKAPIFVIGSSRSGTTMLAELLDAYPELCHFTEHPLTRRHMWHMVKHPHKQNQVIPALEKTLKRLSGIAPRPKAIRENTWQQSACKTVS